MDLPLPPDYFRVTLLTGAVVDIPTEALATFYAWLDQTTGEFFTVCGKSRRTTIPRAAIVLVEGPPAPLPGSE